jgi:hypothetical protein
VRSKTSQSHEVGDRIACDEGTTRAAKNFAQTHCRAETRLRPAYSGP